MSHRRHAFLYFELVLDTIYVGKIISIMDALNVGEKNV